MNTATILAAALLGYTWGYHPLDERSTEFLIQMSPADIDVMASGQSEILVDVPPEAGPVGRVRIIVGEEELPRTALPSLDLNNEPLDTERTAARPTQSAIAFSPQREPANTDRHEHDHSHGAPAHDLGAADRYANPAPPLYTAPIDTIPFDDRHSASIPSGDVVPPPLGHSGIENEIDPFRARPVDPIGEGRSMTDVGGLVDVPPSTSPDAYHTGSGTGMPLDNLGGRSPVITNLGPPLTAVNDRPSFDWDRALDMPSQPADSNTRPLTDQPNGAPGRSPSESHFLGNAQRLGTDNDANGVDKAEIDRAGRETATNDSTDGGRAGNDTSGNWRSWTLVTGPVAFGLFWLNLYQWGTYKSIRRRYLSLLRRTGDV